MPFSRNVHRLFQDPFAEEGFPVIGQPVLPDVEIIFEVVEVIQSGRMGKKIMNGNPGRNMHVFREKGIPAGISQRSPNAMSYISLESTVFLM